MMSQHQMIYILLAVAVIAFAFITIRDWAMQKKLREQQPVVASDKQIREIALPLRLQAYERLVVFLERIHPERLVQRVIEPGIKSGDVRSLMIHSIHSEYDHNLSQQIYVSQQAWEAVSTAKEQLIALINSTAEKMDPGAEGKGLAKQLLHLSINESELPTTTALHILNAEAKKLMADGEPSKGTP